MLYRTAILPPITLPRKVEALNECNDCKHFTNVTLVHRRESFVCATCGTVTDSLVIDDGPASGSIPSDFERLTGRSALLFVPGYKNTSPDPLIQKHKRASHLIDNMASGLGVTQAARSLAMCLLCEVLQVNRHRLVMSRIAALLYLASITTQRPLYFKEVAQFSTSRAVRASVKAIRSSVKAYQAPDVFQHAINLLFRICADCRVSAKHTSECVSLMELFRTAAREEFIKKQTCDNPYAKLAGVSDREIVGMSANSLAASFFYFFCRKYGVDHEVDSAKKRRRYTEKTVAAVTGCAENTICSCWPIIRDVMSRAEKTKDRWD
jgi:hypothetical protein